MLQIVLYIVAVILLCLAAFGVTAYRHHLGWLGLAVAWFAFALLPALT